MEPSVQLLTEALSPGVKRPQHEADHSLPSAEVKNEWSCLHLHSSCIPLCCVCF